MQDPLDAVLRDVVVVEERVGYARDAEEQDAGRGEEEGAEVGPLGGLGEGGAEGQEGRFLWMWFPLSILFFSWGREEEEVGGG